MRTIDHIVEHEILLNVSMLVSDLCNAGPYDDGMNFGESHYDLLVQDDYIEAAEYHADYEGEHDGRYYFRSDGVNYFADSKEEAARDFCEGENIEPYIREALEFWVVTDRLADKLEEQGEMIDRDVHGLTVWGRTTSGQHISMDGVMQRIHHGMNAAA